jgi:hypothetical protein
MKLFIIFTRRQWYRKKRFAIPISLLAMLVIGAIIIGSVLGTRAKTGTTFDVLFSSKKKNITYFCLLFLSSQNLFREYSHVLP